MFERLPPHDIQAEETVIASILVAEDAMARVAGIVTPRDFFREQNAWTYEACFALWERDEGINQVTVAHELEQRGRLDDVGGLAYLTDLINDLPTPIGVEHSAAIVKRDSLYRQMLDVGYKVSQLAFEAGPDVASSLAKAESLIYGLRDVGARPDGFVRLRDYLDIYFDAEADPETAPTGSALRTGLGQLDALIGGLPPAKLIVVAAQTGVGKSVLMMNWVRHVAVMQNGRVAVFSLEMGARELVDRMLAGESRVNHRRLRLGTGSEAETERVMLSLGVLSEAQIFIDFTADLRVSDIQNMCREMARTRGLDLVVVDYLQLMSSEGRSGTRAEEVGKITRALKNLANELGVPIVVASQLSREVDKRNPPIPSLSDLRESGAIEHDADMVIFIYREDLHVKRDEWEKTHLDAINDPYPEGIAQLIVAKHRNGPKGIVEAKFRGDLFKIEDFGLPRVDYHQAEAFI